MTEKEKLIELLDDLFQPNTEKTLGSMADYLLANGVVVLPCRCAECEYKDDELMCPSYHVYFYNRDNWFCADAKRKGGDE